MILTLQIINIIISTIMSILLFIFIAYVKFLDEEVNALKEWLKFLYGLDLDKMSNSINNYKKEKTDNGE